MYTVKTQISFEAAHRLYNVDTYSSECRENIHGHSYKVTIYLGADSLNSAGMVMDFKLLKKLVKETIEDKYDHSCILSAADPLCKPISENCNKVIIVDDNPTAEWMAKSFYYEIAAKLKESTYNTNYLYVKQIDVQETENNVASFHYVSAHE